MVALLPVDGWGFAVGVILLFLMRTVGACMLARGTLDAIRMLSTREARMDADDIELGRISIRIGAGLVLILF